MKGNQIFDFIAANIIGIVCLLFVRLLFKGPSSAEFIAYLVGSILYRVTK